MDGSEARIFSYMAKRYGQHPETEAKYRDAIFACESVMYLGLTTSEIARMHGLKAEAFRGQLKRHFPELLERREFLRTQLGYAVPGNVGLKEKTVLKYRKAVEMLRNGSLTVREAASCCGVSYTGLQQHLIFYHKDIAESRLLHRTEALNKTIVWGEASPGGGVRAPRPEAVAYYAPAVELYRTTDLSVPEIARRCGMPAHNLAVYLRKWYGADVQARRERREAEKAARPPKVIRQTKAQKAAVLYAPAIGLFEEGYSLPEVARKLNVKVYNLMAWLKNNYPDKMEDWQIGMMKLPDGSYVLRRRYNKYKPVAAYIAEHPQEGTEQVAARFGVPVSSLIKAMEKIFPTEWALHCESVNKQK